MQNLMKYGVDEKEGIAISTKQGLNYNRQQREFALLHNSHFIYPLPIFKFGIDIICTEHYNNPAPALPLPSFHSHPSISIVPSSLVPIDDHLTTPPHYFPTAPTIKSIDFGPSI